MDMSKLSGTDFLQIISLTIALVLSFCQSNFPFRNERNKLTIPGFLMILVLVISILLTLATTISKAINDQTNYENLADSTNKTLTTSNTIADSAKSIILLQKSQVDSLIQIQKSETKILAKSDTLFQYSQFLNNQIQEAYKLQLKSTASSQLILKQLNEEKSRVDSGAKLQFILSLENLRQSDQILYKSMQKSSLDPQKVLTDLLRRKKFKDNEELMKALKDTLYQYQLLKLGKEPIRILKIIDTLEFIKSIEDFFTYNMNILNEQLSNPFVIRNKKLLHLLMNYKSFLSKKQTYFYVDRQSIRNVEDLNQLTSKKDELISNLTKLNILNVFILIEDE